jgi:hypothetical protein
MPKIIQPGDANAVSFNDDTSPNSLLTSKQKVSVDAQVLPEHSNDWFYRVLQLCESVSGELKSPEVWARFQSVDNEARRQIWAGLSKVRIHIVDPRPYRKRFDEVLRGVLRCDDPYTTLQQQLARKEQSALKIDAHLKLGTAESILADSFAVRVLDLSRLVNNDSLIPCDENGDECERLTIAEFGNDLKSVVRHVTEWSAKSAAAFHEALECFDEFDETSRFSPNRIVRQRIKERVSRPHAFDEGNGQHIELLKTVREKILAGLTLPGLCVEPLAEALSTADPYPMLRSHSSYFVQAADIAAGIASKLIETENLAHVVTKFEYVTYNGRRVSVADMEEVLRRLRP